MVVSPMRLNEGWFVMVESVMVWFVMVCAKCDGLVWFGKEMEWMEWNG